ncbi:MAG: hypothetical protein N2376_04230 [Clostridia bacterium]|nr:hypothetical protein [Clostridia bacterium]
MIENVSNELKKYFEGKPIISSLLGLDMIVLYASVAFMLLDTFISFGLLTSLVFYVFIVGILLCLANRNFNALMIGLGGAAVIELIRLIQQLTFEYFSWSALFGLLIYGFFAYQAYKKSLGRA